MRTVDSESILTGTVEKRYPKLLIDTQTLPHADDLMIEKFLLLSLFMGLSMKGQASTRQTGGKIQAQTNQLSPTIGNKKGNRWWGQYDNEYHILAQNYKTAGVVSARLTDAGEFMFSVPEANVNKTWNFFEVHAGRFILPWAPMDRAWSLGYVNNRKNFNFYTPGEEGLIGAMAGVDFSFGLKLQTFGSFLYLPELNPSQQVKDGQTSSKNIWASPTPKYAEINGVKTPIRYYLNKPDISSIIFRPTFGQLVGYNYSYFDVNSYYLIKPENSIRAAGDARLTTGGEIIANINAKLYYEEVYGTNFSIKHDGYKAYASWMRVDPKNSPANDPLFVQYIKIESQLEARTYSGFGASKQGDRFNTGFNWIAMLTKPKGSDDILANKSRFREALEVFLTLDITDKLKNNFDIKWDVMKGDKIIMEEIAYEFGRGLVVSTGVNLIDSPTDSSYWSKFRDNDAVYANMAYNY